MNPRTLKRWTRSASAALVTSVAWPALAAPAPDDIRDIRPLILIPPWWYWLAAALAACALLAAVGAGLRYWRRRTKRPLTAQERALEALARAATLAKDGRCREWAELVAQTLRNALAARLGQESCPETTNELAALDWATFSKGATVDAERLIQLLSTCDLTRFALGRLDAAALATATEAARDWVAQLFATPDTPTEPARSTSTAAEATS